MQSKKCLLASVLVCIIMVFAMLGTVGVFMADKICTPEYLISQADKTNTYDNAYQALQTRFANDYSVTNIPSEVYAEAFSSEWIRNAVNEKINSVFEERDSQIDCSAAKKSITAYFEEYAHDAHVLKDDAYDAKLAESIDYAVKTALNETDVFSLDILNKAGIVNRISKAAGLVRRYCFVCPAVLAVLLILLILLKRPVYWLGTALFSSGILLVLPTAYIGITNAIEKFSIKDFTTYTLVTGTLHSLDQSVMTIGIVMAAAGVCLLTGSIVRMQRSHKKETIC